MPHPVEVFLREMLVARIGPELEPVAQRLEPADARVGRVVTLDRESRRKVDQNRASERMHPIAGADREATAARHPAEPGVPSVDVAVEPLLELILVGDAAHLRDETFSAAPLDSWRGVRLFECGGCRLFG